MNITNKNKKKSTQAEVEISRYIELTINRSKCTHYTIFKSI